MRNRLSSATWSRTARLDSLIPEINSTLLEITTIYEKVKKGRDQDVYRLPKLEESRTPLDFQLPAQQQNGEDETIPLVPSFPSGLSEAQTVRFLEFNKFRGLPTRKYLYFSEATSAIQSDTLEGLYSPHDSLNYMELLKSDYYWLNITDPSESDLSVLFTSFNVHDFTISDIRDANTEEKIEFYQHYTFMSIRLLREVKVENCPSDDAAGMQNQSYDGHNFETIKPGRGSGRGPSDVDFNVLLFKNFVITIHNKEWGSINDILGFLNLVCTETVLSPDWVLYSIFIELAQDAQFLLGRIEPKLNEMRLVSTSNINEMSRVLRENYEMEFQLYSIQRFLKPKINILRTLKAKCGRRFGRILLGFLNDIREDFVEMTNELRNLNHILERSQDTFLALVSVEKSREANEMSSVMKRISQIAMVFLPIQALSGFFGMNVRVPFQMEEDVIYFWIIVIFAVALAATMYWSGSYLLKKLKTSSSVVTTTAAKKCPGFWERRRMRRESIYHGNTLPTTSPKV